MGWLLDWEVKNATLPSPPVAGLEELTLVCLRNGSLGRHGAGWRWTPGGNGEVPASASPASLPCRSGGRGWEASSGRTPFPMTQRIRPPEGPPPDLAPSRAEPDSPGTLSSTGPGVRGCSTPGSVSHQVSGEDPSCGMSQRPPRTSLRREIPFSGLLHQRRGLASAAPRSGVPRDRGGRLRGCRNVRAWRG